MTFQILVGLRMSFLDLVFAVLGSAVLLPPREFLQRSTWKLPLILRMVRPPDSNHILVPIEAMWFLQSALELKQERSWRAKLRRLSSRCASET